MEIFRACRRFLAQDTRECGLVQADAACVFTLFRGRLDGLGPKRPCGGQPSTNQELQKSELLAIKAQPIRLSLNICIYLGPSRCAHWSRT